MDPHTRMTYNFPTIVRFGAGVVDEVGPHLVEQGLNSPQIVTDPGLATLPIFTEILGQLKKAGLQPEVFSGIDKNPVKKNVLDGVEHFKSTARDSIVGLGGGASMDVARAIALKAYHDRDLFDFDDALGGDKYVTEKIPYFVTIPTTSGTGSEVGRSTVISEDKSHQKRVLFSPRLMPPRVFADPALTLGLPPHITAAVGMDALTHNLEAFFSKGFSPLCDGVAIEGIRLVHHSLVAATNQSNLQNRSMMMMAALMGATAFQKGLGVVHSTAHPLSTLFDTHHGLANAVMLPYGVQFNSDVVGDKMKFLCGVLDLGEKSEKAFVDYIVDLKKKLKMPKSLAEIGVGKKHIDDLAELGLKDVCHRSNPKSVSLDDFKSIYANAFGGVL